MAFNSIIKSIFYIICFIFILNVSIIKFNDDNLYINSICQLNDEEQGICKYLLECENAKNNLINLNIKPKICSFNQHEPIICCKVNETENLKTVTETNFKIDIDENVTIDKSADNEYAENEKRISENKCNNLFDSQLVKVYGRRPTKRDTMTTKMFNTSLEEISNQTLPNMLEEISNQTSPKPMYITTPIAGGKSVFYKQYPFMAAIGWETFNNRIEFKCGGTLIESNFVVTAAHCCDIGGSKPKIIRTGGVNLDKDYLTNDDITIKNIFIHPNYTNSENYNDIALIQLTKHSIDTPVCIYQEHEINEKFQYAKAIGYGQTQFAGPDSKSLLQIEINLIKNKDCNIYYPPDEKYPNSIIDTQICAFDPHQIQDTCPGDSGGPIFIEENIPKYKKINITYIIGVTSFGKFCASDSPGVYTRISSYLDWIESIVWSDEII